MKQDTQVDAMRRMKIIQGQVAKITSMIEENAYCPDTITQILAVQNAMKQVEAKLLEGHMQTCVVNQVKKGNEKKAISELLQLFNLSKKS